MKRLLSLTILLILVASCSCKKDPTWLNVYTIAVKRNGLMVNQSLKAEWYLHSSITHSCSFYLNGAEIASYSDCMEVAMPEGGYHVEQWRADKE